MEREPLHVLLVEDEASLREPLARHLQSAHDYQVDTAADAAKAWQLVVETSHPYDVALIDDLLTPEPDVEPEPIGVQLVERIRARCAETECILFTGWGMERALAALRVGAYRYLAKPLNLDELGITIRMAAEQAHLRRERDLLSITLEISNAMVERLGVTQTLEAIAEAIPKLGGAEACAVALEDPATRRVRYQTRILIGDVKVRWQRHMQDVFLTRQIIDNGQAFIMPDVDAHAGQVDENLRQAGIKSFAGIPIPGEPRNQGVLYAYSTHQEAFGTYEQRVLTLLANQAAIALQNAHLFEAETQRRREAETLRELGVALNASLKLEEVLDRVAMSCQRLIHAETSTALIYDERRKNYIQRGVADHPERPVIVREPRPDGYTQRVIETGEPLIVSDLIQDAGARADHLELGIRSMAAVPIQLADKTIGVLFVHSTVPHRFDDHQVALLSVLANQAAIAISNAQYFDENARRMKELEHLHRAAEKLASVASVRDVLQQIVKSAREVLAADSAVIWSYDQVRHTFLPDELVADGIQPELVDAFRRDEPRRGGTAEIVMERNYLAVPDVDAPEYAFLASPGRGLRGAIDVQAFQGIALQAGDEALGVLYVNYQQARSFGAEAKATLQTLAYHAALTLKKARLLDQVSKARDAARVVAEVSVLEDLSKTLHSVARGTQHALDCDAVTLYAYDQRRAQFEFPPTMRGVRIADQVIELGRVSKKSVIWRILALEETHVAEDAPSDPVMRGPFVQREGIQSSVGIPLRVGDRKVGVMFVNYRDCHRFTGEELTNIELFANQAAVAICNAQLYEETIRRTNALEALYEAGKIVTSTLALDEILDRIVEQARNLTGHRRKQARFCDLELIEGSKLKRKAAYPPQHLAGLEKRVGEIDLGQNEHTGITGRTARTGQSQLVGDVTRDPDYIAYDPATRSELAVPIKIGEKVIGVINVEHPDRNAFDQDDQRNLESLAAQAAIAIENARLYQVEQQRVEELAGLNKISQSIRSLTNIYEVYKQVSESIAQLVGAQMCAVLLYDPAVETLVCQLPMYGVSDEIGRQYRIPVGKDVPTNAIWRGQNYLILNSVDRHPLVATLGLKELAEEAGLRDTSFAKLTTGNRDIGVIQASNKLDGTPFNQDDAQLLCIFAGQAAAVIENARLYEAEQQHGQALRAIQETSAAVSAVLDPDTLLPMITDRAAKIFTAPATSLMLWGSHEKNLIIRAAFGLGNKYRQRQRISRAVVDKIVEESGLGPHVFDIHHKPIGEPNLVKSEDLYTALTTPLTIGDELIGILNIYSKGRTRQFDETEKELAMIFANHAATAIHNAQLYHQATDRLEESQTLQQIATSLAGTLKLDDLLNLVMAAAMDLTDTSSGSILFWDESTEQFTRALSTTKPDGAIKSHRSQARYKGGIARTIIDQRKPVVISDTHKHPRVSPVAIEKGRRALIGVPLVSREEVIGVLYVNTSEPCQFSNRQVTLLQSLASQAAVAIERARQYEELKRTKGLIGARTALAWMGMASSAWRHTIDKHALTIRELAQLLGQEWAQISPGAQRTNVGERTTTIERLATQILAKPITPPLSTEAGLERVSLTALAGERARQLWQNAPYRETTLRLDLQLLEGATVRANPEWLRRAFDMLVDNAVQAVADRDIKEIVIGSRSAAGGAEILVSDTGPGIPEEIRAKIGLELIEKPQDAEGMGMGLLMAQTIVQTYGGEIRVASTGPTGTTMVIWLPLHENISGRGQWQ